MLENKESSSRPSTLRYEENITRRHTFTLANQHLIIWKTSQQTELSPALIQAMLTKDLNMRCICATFIPHILTDDKKEE
jgi:hypothetical protein